MIKNPQVGDIVWHTFGAFMGGQYPASYRVTRVHSTYVLGTLVEYVPEPETSRYLARDSSRLGAYLPLKDLYRTKEAAWSRYRRNLEKERARVDARHERASAVLQGRRIRTVNAEAAEPGGSCFLEWPASN